MLPVVGRRRLGVRPPQGLRGEDLDVQAPGPGAHLTVRDIVEPALRPHFDAGVDHHRVRQGAIGGQPHQVALQAQGVHHLDEAAQDVLKWASGGLHPGFGQDLGQDVVGRGLTCGDDNPLEPPAAAQAFDLTQDHGLSQEGPEDLARQAAGTHPRLKNRRGHGGLPCCPGHQ